MPETQRDGGNGVPVVQKRRPKTRNDGESRKPKPPFPAQHQEKPGIEAELRPRPKYEAPDYKAAGSSRARWR